MMLCDVGNTSYSFLDEPERYKCTVEEFNPASVTKEIYYICVNDSQKKILSKLTNWTDLEPFIDKSHYYKTMGIDRIMAVEAVQNGVIIDAGSAVTVDVVREGVFEGGYILPGMQAMQQCYANISPALDYSFNFELDLGKMAKNSQDAISYGYLKLLHDEVMSHDLPIIVTGGDARLFQKLFSQAHLREDLVFEGMKKIIKKADLCSQ